jgi:16S rRNA G1207 methylase RsmC
MLADFPEPNGWDLKNKNVFSKGTLESHVAKARVLIGNPPFETLAGSNPEKPAPAALLDRAIGKMAPGGFLGMVLPSWHREPSRPSASRLQCRRPLPH